MSIHRLRPAVSPAPSSGSAESLPNPPPPSTGPLGWLSACFPRGRRSPSRTSVHEIPPRQPLPARRADAIRDPDCVHLPLDEIGPESLDEAMSMLRERAPLRGLAITRGASACRPDEQALAGILQVHKDSLKDLSLALPLGFSPGLTGALAGLGGLASLRLDNTFMSGTDATTVPRLANALGALQNLRSLAVTGFGDAAALTACLPRLPQLESLRIRSGMAEGQDWRAIARNLQGLQAEAAGRLRHLELSAADADDMDIAVLVPVLSGFPGLHELVLCGNDIRSADMEKLADRLRGMGKTLQTLDLSGSRLHGDGITHLAGALETLPQLRKLHLRGACLTAAAIGRLGTALRGSLSLQSLELSFNPLGGGKAADWETLLGAGKLESLCLSNCWLDSKDMAPLAAGLKKCPTLKTLVLTGNAARLPEAAQALAAGLAGLQQLQTCHLPVLGTQEGLRHLQPALQELRGLCLRNVQLAPIDAEMAPAELRSVLPGTQGR